MVDSTPGLVFSFVDEVREDLDGFERFSEYLDAT
jgi:hypothetical protein